MFLAHTPTKRDLDAFLAVQRASCFSYDEVGATASTPPSQYTIDRNRVQLGAGRATYERAIAAVRRWEMFNIGWVTLYRRDTPIEVGRDVAIAIRVGPVWWLSASRIVYIVGERDPVRRFGFAYGTLRDHAEAGEERFTVEWRADDSVWYDILAFSRPRHPLARLGNPVARMLQRRFARDSKSAMARASGGKGGNGKGGQGGNGNGGQEATEFSPQSNGGNGKSLHFGIRIEPAFHAIHQFRYVEVDQQPNGTVGQAQVRE